MPKEPTHRPTTHSPAHDPRSGLAHYRSLRAPTHTLINTHMHPKTRARTRTPLLPTLASAHSQTPCDAHYMIHMHVLTHVRAHAHSHPHSRNQLTTHSHAHPHFLLFSSHTGIRSWLSGRTAPANHCPPIGSGSSDKCPRLRTTSVSGWVPPVCLVPKPFPFLAIWNELSGSAIKPGWRYPWLRRQAHQHIKWGSADERARDGPVRIQCLSI